MPTLVIAPPVSEALHIPSPSVNGFHIGPLFIHVYALMYLVGIAAGDHHHAPPLGRGRAATPS